MSVPSSSQNPMWANAMREILEMLGDSADPEVALVRKEAEDKLYVFLGWLSGTLPKPTDEERQRLVREVTVLYRKAKAQAARFQNLSDESTERLIDPDAPRTSRRSASNE